MLSKKSPSGAMFPYYYKNGELFGMHLDSYEDREDDLIAMMKAEEAFFMQERLTLGMWLNFYGTRLTDRVLRQLTEMICHFQPRIAKLALVGVSFWDRRKVNRLFKEAGVIPRLPVRYYSDPEEAKTWLVNEMR
ncbi:MAG TPA: hypothetical protein VN203_04930 [Candidatus Acidoferrum sp.]|nr:hypothetical protein [Candidatus Acidoferrum sp.]